MEMRVFGISLLLYSVAVSDISSVTSVLEVEAQEPTARSLSILLTTGLYAGHLFPLVSLGEELVRRGHNVTLCANVMKGSHLYPEVPERVGIRFVSAGYDLMTQGDFEAMHMEMQNAVFSINATMKLMNIGASSLIQIRSKVEEIGVDQFDIIISDISILPIAVYFSERGKKAVVFSTLMLYFPSILPAWPTPLASSGQTENLSFLERFFNTLFVNLFLKPFFFGAVFQSGLYNDSSYRKVLKGIDVMNYPGLHIPLIFNTAFGLEYPKSRYPLVEHVGPVLMNSLPPMDKELQQWLDKKTRKSVIYISMGTTGFLKANNIRALLDGVMATPYSAVWVFKRKNREGYNLTDFETLGERLFLAMEWVPQQTVLKHKSILMSILHCGLNGVQESLSNSLPIICVPFGYDQFEIATKIVSAGVGIPLSGFIDFLKGNTRVEAERVTNSVYQIVSGDYARNASRMKKCLN